MRGGSAFGIYPLDRYRRLELFGSLIYYNERYNDPTLEEYSNNYQEEVYGTQLFREGTAMPLGVAFVQETTVFRDGDRMRINAQLVEPVSLRYVWSQTYERDVKDVLAAQRELVDAIAADVAGTLGGKAVAARSPEEPAP